MNRKKNMTLKEIAVIGGGVVGSSTAFNLALNGHKVTLIDPKPSELNNSNGIRSGTNASLGVLMGNIFGRSKGRSWHLRQRSMELWPKWIEQLSTNNNLLELKKPLLKIASTNDEKIKLQELCKDKAHLGLKFIENDIELNIKSLFPNFKYGGLISSLDGRIQPSSLMKSLIISLEKLKVNKINKKVLSLNRLSQSSIKKWKINLEQNHTLIMDYVIICSSLNSQSIIKTVGYEYSMEPILGQAIEITINNNISLVNLPSVINFNGVNLIPNGKNKMLVGATLEPGEKANEEQLKKMKSLYGNAPKWLQNAQIKQQWYGIRARPQKQPAPILENLEPGLIINTGHYRNGILLAPACAEWVTKQIS